MRRLERAAADAGDLADALGRAQFPGAGGAPAGSGADLNVLKGRLDAIDAGVDGVLRATVPLAGKLDGVAAALDTAPATPAPGADQLAFRRAGR